ncbi:NRDE family protein [Alcaligenes sp. SORT26]|uniref:NRDE family protein n=1 Tax=Alcaligenes sp. SORT26 TaxID=2813780 RepID=UPI001A9F7389|nr:NRDE family protein [Alcaligenes sp. SORT26]QTC00645.1 NRDE family protein [Alcaligenes sp. SORT26]
MCIAYIAVGVNADWPLIIAANRDEYHARPSQAAKPWQDEPDILAGRDLLAGGTWLGLTQNRGRLALLTNYREIPGSKTGQQRSRGELIPQFLRDERSPKDYLEQLALQGADYAGFNLFVLQWPTGDQPLRLGYYSNRHHDGSPHILEPGVHVLSNAWLNTPWPKSLFLKETLQAQHFDGSEPAFESLFQGLRNQEVAPDTDLPKTGLSLEHERLLSSPFIVSPDYGTRCTTVIAINQQGQGLLRERSFNADAQVSRQHDWPVSWPGFHPCAVPKNVHNSNRAIDGPLSHPTSSKEIS